MADGGAPGELALDVLGLARVVETERLDDRADLLVRVQQLLAPRVERREPGRQLTPVLQVQQDPRHEPRHLSRRRRGVSGDVPDPVMW